MEALSKSDLMGVGKVMLFCPQKPRFYFYSTFAYPAFLGFWAIHFLFIILLDTKGSNGNETYKSSCSSLKEAIYISNVQSG